MSQLGQRSTVCITPLRNLRKLLTHTIAIPVLVLVNSEVIGRVAPTQLEWIFSNADIVAIGRDLETLSSGEWLLAVFEIEETIKGDVGPGDRVVYVAEPTWTCDGSRASIGQKALLFLTESVAPAPDFANKRSPIDGRLPPPWRTDDGKAIYKITASGNGRMDIAANGSASVQTYVVVLPKELREQATEKDEFGGLSTVPAVALESYLRSLPTEPSPTPTKKTGPLPASKLRP